MCHLLTLFKPKILSSSSFLLPLEPQIWPLFPTSEKLFLHPIIRGASVPGQIPEWNPVSSALFLLASLKDVHWSPFILKNVFWITTVKKWRQVNKNHKLSFKISWHLCGPSDFLEQNKMKFCLLHRLMGIQTDTPATGVHVLVPTQRWQSTLLRIVPSAVTLPSAPPGAFLDPGPHFCLQVCRCFQGQTWGTS